MIKTLIYLDEEDMRHSIDLLEVAERMHSQKPQEVSAIIFGNPGEASEGYFDWIYQFNIRDEQKYDVRLMASCMEKLIREKRFSGIVIPATNRGRMLAPMLAMKLKTGLVADVVEVSNVNGAVQMVRPTFDGKLMACITNQNSEFIMMSVRAGVFHYDRTATKKTRIISQDIEENICGVRLIECIHQPEKKDIREAKVLVSGGGGVGEHFQKLNKLATLLGGMTSSSRRLVDSGVTSRNIQVGQSGKTVSPELYIALGIYGSLQHIVGLKNVQYIISVNTNKNAPICSLSQIVVEGDAIEFVDKISQRIEESNKQ